jgi:uncharacterized protein (TIGR02996 family)
MNDEAAFAAAIQNAPEDGDIRLAYADWLEARGDVRGEYLRLEHQLSQMQLTRRLAHVREQIDPSWIALVRRDAGPMTWYPKRFTQRIVEGKAVPGVYFPETGTPVFSSGERTTTSLYRNEEQTQWGFSANQMNPFCKSRVTMNVGRPPLAAWTEYACA